MKRIVSGIMLTLLLTGMLTLTFNIQPVKAEPRTWIVDDDGPAGFHIIQEAINAANPGDIIYVKAGTYYENVHVNKSLALVGKETNTTIIDGSKSPGEYYVVGLDANNIILTGFTVRNGNFGIHFNHMYCLVKECNIRNNTCAILFEWGPSNNIEGNMIWNNTYGIAFTDSSHYNIVRSNTIWNNYMGIYIEHSINLSIYHNNFINNTVQVHIEKYGNNSSWDVGHPTGGNYWSDYVGVDVKSGSGQDLPGSDGIGDTPYVVDANNVDHYPLMSPYGAPPPPTYALTITTTIGGKTDPASGTYSYTENSSVQVTAIPEAGYLFDYWKLDDVNVGSANPYTVLMEKNHTLKAVFSRAPPTIPVGGYSFSIQVHVKTESVLTYIALIATLTAIFTKLRPKAKRKH